MNLRSGGWIAILGVVWLTGFWYGSLKKGSLLLRGDGTSRLSVEDTSVPVSSVCTLCTSIPIYYVNLARSKNRRRNIERMFQNCCKKNVLHRIEAVNAFDDVSPYIDLHGMKLEDYRWKCGATGKGSLALLSSYLLAVQQAYTRGHEVILLLEDDMTDILVPHWRWNLEEVTAQANEMFPNWSIIQLQACFEQRHQDFYYAWLMDPSTPFVNRTLLQQNEVNVWGAGATLWSRKGMKTVLEKVMVGENGKIDFLPLKESLPPPWDRRFGANPDKFLYNLDPQYWQALLVSPPMFTVRLNEGSTGIRAKANHHQNEDVITNDDGKIHVKSTMLSLESSVVAGAFHWAKVELGHEDIDASELTYMKMMVMDKKLDEKLKSIVTF